MRSEIGMPRSITVARPVKVLYCVHSSVRLTSRSLVHRNTTIILFHTTLRGPPFLLLSPISCPGHGDQVLLVPQDAFPSPFWGFGRRSSTRRCSFAAGSELEQILSPKLQDSLLNSAGLGVHDRISIDPWLLQTSRIEEKLASTRTFDWQSSGSIFEYHAGHVTPRGSFRCDVTDWWPR